MPSLYPDPATLPPLPMMVSGIIVPLESSVKALHKKPPDILPKLLEVIETLVRVSLEVSAKQESKDIVEQLTDMLEVSGAQNVTEGVINRQLIRHQRDVATVRHHYGFLTTWLCLIDRWIVNCEQFARTHLRYKIQVEAFELIHKDLTAVVRKNTDHKTYRFADLLQLFEILGISNCDEQLHSA
ncbi:hypothetical protein F5Y18DRAFT_377529 [Xylariaceae sp. FL1019]|nr:hypothetical protein F5Y18DRAFT_377529 [Xylariaceae sp. FL1019]